MGAVTGFRAVAALPAAEVLVADHLIAMTPTVRGEQVPNLASDNKKKREAGIAFFKYLPVKIRVAYHGTWRASPDQRTAMCSKIHRL